MNDPFPLSPLQEGMFLGSAGSDTRWNYLEQIVCHLEDEAVDAGAMRQAWASLLARHPSLRIVIDPGQGDAPVQRVVEDEAIAFDVFDWTGHSAEQVKDDFAAFLTSDRNLGVDPSDFPAFRVALFQTGPAQGKLVWTFPHTLLDGRSFAGLLDEVFDLYAQFLKGETPAEPAPETQNIFADHCTALASLSHEDGLTHFAKALSGWEGGAGLLVAKAEPARKQQVEHALTKAQTHKLTQLAKAAQVPMSTVVMAAWGIVTARLAGRSDTVFGATLNGRHLVPGSATAIGCFIVTVPMRMRLSQGLTIGDVLTQMRSDQIALRDHEQTPLTQIRRVTDVPPGVPLFDSLVMFETATLDQQMKSRSDAWQARRVDLYEEGDSPVTLAAYLGDALQLHVEYDPAQMPMGPRLGQYMVQFLQNLADANPQTPLAELSMLSADEMRSLRDLSGEKQAAQNKVECCTDMFDAVVARHPDQIAVLQDGTDDLSYRALDRAANQLAQNLIENGIQPNDTIGICAARSPAFITAILAIWKSGATFVPMDPTYPIETLNIIGEDSGAKLILVDATAPEFTFPTLRIDTLSLDGDAAAPDIPARAADDPAYVIFTSGSTGRPKGVAVSQASLAAHSRAAQSFYGISPSDRCLQFASLSFDVALEEIVTTLLAGATLALRSPEMSQSMTVFLEKCVEHKLTVVNLPTGFWVALTDALEDAKTSFPPSVRLVIVGGERVPLSVLRRWNTLVPGVEWINGYGPTEATITCTAHKMTHDDLSRLSVPIGRPLDHAAAWVLGADGSLAPQGTEGQLWISGPAVALGYVGLPEKTAESFVPARFQPGLGRIYGTGDKAVWRDDLLHYIGRSDRQIKLRGFRIEPGQIEQVLEAQDDVGRSHVAVHNTPGTQPKLVAWFSASDPGAPPDIADLSARLADALPVHMRPELVAVNDWAQTPGGKIDTKQLPDPVVWTPDNAGDEEKTPLTQEVAELFAEFLNVDDLPSDASFFDYGGDSLLLLRLLAKTEQRLGVRLKPTALYSDPTPRGMVKALQSQDMDPLVVIPIQPEGTTAPLYGVHVTGDNGSYFRPLAKALGKDQPVFGLTVGLLSEDTPTAVPDIARFYLHQIERHQPEGPLSLAAVSAGSYVTFELAQQLIAAGRDVRALILLDAEGPDGRPRVGKLARILVHARQFLRRPIQYTQKILAEKVEDLKHKMARKKLSELDDMDGEMVQSLAAFTAANTLAIEQYEPQPFPQKLTIVRAADDMFDSAEAREKGLGWSSVAAGGFEVCDVPGSHLGILDPPNVNALSAYIAPKIQGSGNG
ncbi:MAG: amino acid adenylation domain-containing protein [Sulfitobacter sp.]